MKKKYKKIVAYWKKQSLNFLQFTILLLASFSLIMYLISQPLNSSSEEDLAIEAVDKETFVMELSPYAQEFSKSHGLRPSLLIAQAALESNWGNSQLARESNNYFGIKNKAGRSYQTKEFQESDWKEVQANFKEYPSLYESILDYADLLKHGTSWDDHLYDEVIAAENYQKAAYALTEAGYATDPAYAEKLIQIIDQYELDKLD